jgi:hypothetical protein
MKAKPKNKKTNKKALYALVPLLGLALTGSAHAAETKVAIAQDAQASRPPFEMIGGHRGGMDFGQNRDSATDSGKMGHRGGPRGEESGRPPTPPLKDIATVLGTTETDLQTLIKSGKTIDQIITDKGLSKTTVYAQLKTQRDANEKTRLADAVKTGKITQAQADQVVADKAAHDQQELQTLATALGTTVDKVKSDRDAGKTLDETITSLGLNKATIMAKLKAAGDAKMKTELAAQVTAGKLTQAQADTMIKNMSEGKAKHDEALAKALGMSTTELKASLDNGKTVDQIITDKGLSKDQVFQSMKPAKTDGPIKSFFHKLLPKFF